MTAVGAPTRGTMEALGEEIARARTAFPGNARRFSALTEEFLELARALNDGEPPERVRAEALQVACCAVRLAEEGDAAFPPPEAARDEREDAAFRIFEARYPGWWARARESADAQWVDALGIAFKQADALIEAGFRRTT